MAPPRGKPQIAEKKKPPTFRCGVCPSRFKTNVVRERHCLTKHAERFALAGVCAICAEPVRDKFALATHFRTIHSDKCSTILAVATQREPGEQWAENTVFLFENFHRSAGSTDSTNYRKEENVKAKMHDFFNHRPNGRGSASGAQPARPTQLDDSIGNGTTASQECSLSSRTQRDETGCCQAEESEAQSLRRRSSGEDHDEASECSGKRSKAPLAEHNCSADDESGQQERCAAPEDDQDEDTSENCLTSAAIASRRTSSQTRSQSRAAAATNASQDSFDNDAPCSSRQSDARQQVQPVHKVENLPRLGPDDPPGRRELKYWNKRSTEVECPRCGKPMEGKAARQSHYKTFHYTHYYEIVTRSLTEFERWTFKNFGNRNGGARVCLLCPESRQELPRMMNRIELIRHHATEHPAAFDADQSDYRRRFVDTGERPDGRQMHALLMGEPEEEDAASS